MIEFYSPVNPGALTTNGMKRCSCNKGHPSSHSTPAHKKARAEFAKHAREALRDESLPVYPDGRVHIEIYVTPKKIHRKGCAVGLAGMDDDAPVKAIRDALEGIAYTDDAQCKRTISEKFTREESSVGIVVRIYRPEEQK